MVKLKLITLRLTPQEIAEIKAAAQREGRSMANWCNRILLAATISKTTRER